jgi:N-acetylglucosaminyldiphosphoundecaprenol N-acetyl-beta-D-mannosaminyltransferase
MAVAVEVRGDVPRAHEARELSWIFDIPIDLGRPEDLLGRITGWARRNGDGPRLTPAGEFSGDLPLRGPRRVMYANAHVLNQSAGNSELRGALEAADLVYCDGYGVRLAAKALEAPIPHRMTGADWIWSLAAMCEQIGESIYLLGSEPGVAGRAAGRLGRRFPALDVVGHHHGYFEVGSPHDDRVIEDINARRPSILLVGMGTPKQELWVQANAHRLDVDVLWTVGALFDVVSGKVPRAPGWLADNGLEWIFRLAIEPGRMWRRYLLGNPVFMRRVMTQARTRHDG